MESSGIEKNSSSRKKWFHLSIILMLFLIFEPFSGADSLELVHDDLPRVPRAIDPLEMSLERMRMISRIATGIHLVQEIVKGTADVDQITSELLRMGSVTPSLIAKMNATEMEGIIDLIRSVKLEGTQKYPTPTEELYLKMMVEINEFMKNVDDITVWPERAAFEAAIVKKNPDAVKVALDFKSNCDNWRMMVDSWKKTKDDSDFNYINSYTKSLLEDFSKLRPDEIIFLPTGTTMESFAQPFKTANYVEVLKKGRPFFYSITKITGNVVALGKSLPFTSHFQSLKNLLLARNALGSSGRHKTTIGFMNGVDDLAYLPHDVTEEWMSRMINSSKSLENSMDVMKTVLHSLKSSDRKMGELKKRHSAAISAIDKQTTLLETLSRKSNDTTAALSSLGACDGVRGEFNETKIFSILHYAIQMDEEFLNIKTSIIAAIKTFRSDGLMTKLEKLSEMLSGNLTESKAEITAHIDELYKPMVDLYRDKLKFGHFDVHFKAEDIGKRLGNVTEVFSIVASTFRKSFECAKVAIRPDLLKKTLVLIGSLRNASYDYSTINDDAVNVIRTITGLSDELIVATEVMKNLKGQKNVEWENLKLLKDPKNTAFIIGKTVQWVVVMNEVSKKMADIQKVIDNIELVRLELSKTIGVFLEDAQHLMALSGLKDKFQTLKTELSLWKDEVSNVRVEKLEDASRIYTPGDRVTGIYENLTPMVSALGNLIAAYPNSSVIHNLTSLKQSLDVLIMYDLNFLNYKVVPLEADESFSDLATFFTNFSSAMSSSPTTVKPSEPRLEKDEDGLRSSSGNETSKQVADSTDWFTDDTLTSLTIVLICVCCLFSVIATFCSQCKELKDQRAELAGLKSRNRDLSAQLQIENNRMSKSAEILSKKKGRRSRTASSMMSAESRSKEVAE